MAPRGGARLSPPKVPDPATLEVTRTLVVPHTPPLLDRRVAGPSVRDPARLVPESLGWRRAGFSGAFYCCAGASPGLPGAGVSRHWDSSGAPWSGPLPSLP